MSTFKLTLLSFIKGVIVALLFSIVAVLIFAAIISAFNLSSGVIKPVNVLIKIVSVSVGVFIAVRGDKGLLKGALLGVIITVLALTLFSIIGGESAFTSSIIWELLLGAAIGAISGIFSVNLKK